jgi:hypothetical protein
MQPTYQTVRLSKGKHTSPAMGACVMELASMLAGEPFNDHPRCVSRSIGAFLRGYNDVLDDERRQDLYAYAAKVVGTASSLAVENAREARLLEWGDEQRQRRARWWPPARLGFGGGYARRRHPMSAESAGRYALHALGKVSDETHAAALALVDELIALGAREEPLPMLPALRQRLSLPAKP